jgi:hypothetical protein
LGSADAKADIARARNQQREAEEEIADLIRFSIPAAQEALATAEREHKAACGALERHEAEIEMRLRIRDAAEVDDAIIVLVAALKKFEARGSTIMGFDVLPGGMMGSSTISRTAEIVGHRRIRAALPKSFLNFYPGALHEETPATSLEASERRTWSLPEENADDQKAA